MNEKKLRAHSAYGRFAAEESEEFKRALREVNEKAAGGGGTRAVEISLQDSGVEVAELLDFTEMAATAKMLTSGGEPPPFFERRRDGRVELVDVAGNVVFAASEVEYEELGRRIRGEPRAPIDAAAFLDDVYRAPVQAAESEPEPRNRHERRKKAAERRRRR